MAVKTKSKKRVAVLDQENCINCGVCAAECKRDAVFSYKKIGLQETFYRIVEGFCDGCGNCKQECPVGCIKIKEI